ncbi:MAG: cytochrome b [Legionellaceae bacterium]|nr:cytochrome b [Legionellaceae bacterium]
MQRIREEYSSLSKFFHWTIALIVIPMVLGSFFLGDLPSGVRGTAIALHKSFGLTVLLLMLLRIIWIFFAGRPVLPDSVPRWQRILAHAVQYALYLTVLAMPLVGWMMSQAAGHTPRFFGLFALPFPGISENKALSDLLFDIHQKIAFVIIGLLCLHIAGAIKHYFIDKDVVVKRMLPRWR